jgi:hypothetical protein
MVMIMHHHHHHPSILGRQPQRDDVYRWTITQPVTFVSLVVVVCSDGGHHTPHTTHTPVSIILPPPKNTTVTLLPSPSLAGGGTVRVTSRTTDGCPYDDACVSIVRIDTHIRNNQFSCSRVLINKSGIQCQDPRLDTPGTPFIQEEFSIHSRYNRGNHNNNHHHRGRNSQFSCWLFSGWANSRSGGVVVRVRTSSIPPFLQCDNTLRRAGAGKIDSCRNSQKTNRTNKSSES